MADPVTWALIASVAAGGLSAAGQYRQGQYQEKMAEYNAGIANNEAIAAQQKADYDAEASAQKFKILMGRQRAMYAKAGVDITSGSPLLMLSNQALEAEKERQAIQYGGNIASQSEKNKATMFRFQGKNAGQAGQINAASTFLSSLANAGVSKYNYEKPRGTYY